MSKFFREKYQSLVPYTPGEQPRDMQYIKLNTNESPYPPSETAQSLAAKAAGELQLYPDPECSSLVNALADLYHIQPNQILLTNGSDEILNFAFMAFCDSQTPALFPDITYGFYKVFAAVNCLPYEEAPLNPDFTINKADYKNAGKTIFLANPNAPTGIALSLTEIEEIVKSNPEHVVVIDEAYVDFGAESVVPLIEKYDNLLITQTFSKSRSMAGARLGFGIGCEALINDLKTIKYATNPYNINRMTLAAGLGCIQDEAYTQQNCRAIIQTRQDTARQLKEIGFELTDSSTNFLFCRHPKLDGKELYQKLKTAGILVRHFDTEQLRQYNRITIGTREQMDILIRKIKTILEETI